LAAFTLGGQFAGAEVVTTRERILSAGNVHDAADLIRGSVFEPELHDCDPVEACRRLLGEGSMMGNLIDVIQPDGSFQVIGVGGGAFVANDLVLDARERPRPGLVERVLRARMTCNPIVLSGRQIEMANPAEGISFVVLFHHWVDGLSEQVELEVRRHLMVSFLRDVKGYNLAEVLAEGRECDLKWSLAGGFRVRSDYASWYAQHRDPQPRRVLVGMARSEAADAQGSVMSLVFDYAPPRFGFTASQRRLLSQAIQFKTDAEIASALAVSLSAVKKTWAAIFDKVSDVFPEMADELRETTTGPNTRGAQKRHRLLTYLHDHPEEIKP
jgi:hypothetical protein